MSYKTKEAKQFQSSFIAYVTSEANAQEWRMDKTSGRLIYVDAIFFLPRVDMDCNNYWKVMLDAITDTGVVWLDDNVVLAREQGLYYDTLNPHIDISVHLSEQRGVFNDERAASEFAERCASCSRFAHNCKLLRGAMEGRIDADIQNGHCDKYKELNNSRRGSGALPE